LGEVRKGDKPMKFITVSELRLKATEVVREIEETREEVIITKKGKPVVLMRFIEHEAFSLKETEKEKEVKKKHGKRYL
jgi:PHD/YefM family antitoxin component YafN of YafNO toxin-antitoxin module